MSLISKIITPIASKTSTSSLISLRVVLFRTWSIVPPHLHQFHPFPTLNHSEKYPGFLIRNISEIYAGYGKWMLGKSCPFAKICFKWASFFFIHIAIQRKNAQHTPAFPRRFTDRHCQGGGYPACRLPKKQEREKILQRHCVQFRISAANETTI